MKIVLLTRYLSPEAGGIASVVPDLARSLISYTGLRAEIVGILDSRHPVAWAAWGDGYVHAFNSFGPRLLDFAPCLIRALEVINPDLIDVQGMWRFPSYANLSWFRRHRRPYVITPHGMLHPWSLRQSRIKKYLALLAFEHSNLRNAHLFRATSLEEASHIRASGFRQPIAVVPHGVVMPRAERFLSARDRRRRIVFLSRLHPVKGLDYLLRAWCEIQDSVPEWELVVAGPGRELYLEEMRAMVSGLGGTRIRWLGRVDGERKAELFRSADLFVLPSHTENFGQVIAEALAYRVPVITTKNAPWEGLLRYRCGWWIELSHEALVAALVEAVALSDADREAMGKRAGAWMERDFAWRSVAGQVGEVYEWILGGGQPPVCVITD